MAGTSRAAAATSRDLLAAIVASSDDAIAAEDLEGRIICWNTGATQLFGYSADEMLGHSIAVLEPASLRGEQAALLAAVRRGERVKHFETVRQAKDGRLIPVSISLSPVINEAGKIVGISRIVRDISERRSAEAARQEAQAELARVARISLLGEFAASIAHEINQPLAAIVANGGALMRWLAHAPPELGEANVAAERMVRDATRASDVVRRLRSLVTRNVPRYAALDLNRVLKEVLEFIGVALRRAEVELRTELAPGLPSVRGDAIQLQQVVANLVVNAIEAMEPVAGRPRVLTVRTQMEGAGEVAVEIADTGVGLDMADAGQLFDQLVTTKPGGTGLGLPIARGIVEAHGGRIWARPGVPHGAVFGFTVPCAAEGAA